MKIISFFLLLSVSSLCTATDTLDCTGEPYNLMAHIGSDDNDNDIVSDVLLYQNEDEGCNVKLGFNEIKAIGLHWRGVEGENNIHLESAINVSPTVVIKADNTGGTITVDGKTNAITCDWLR